MSSIRSELVRSLALAILLLFALCGTGLYLFVRSALTAEFDAGLEAQARLIIQGTEIDEDGDFELELEGEGLGDAGGPVRDEYYQIWRVADAETVLRSRSLEGGDLLRPDSQSDGLRSAEAVQGTRALRFHDVTLPGDGEGRAVIALFVPAREGSDEVAGGRYALMLARSRGDLDKVLGILASALMGTGLVLAVGAGSLVLWAVGRGLRPLKRVGESAAEIDADHLGRRFPVEEMPTELRPICTRLNDLMERLERAFARERRFNAATAHELRTPLAELRSLAEVGMEWSPADQESGDPREYFRDARAIALQMERLIAALFALTRGQQGGLPVDQEPLDLAALVRQSWKPLAEKAKAKELSVRFDLPDEAAVRSDSTLLRAVLSNLLSNAMEYAPEESTVRCSVSGSGERLRVDVENDAPELGEEDLEHLIEPFWRKDAARSDGGHSGVGLAIAAAYAKLLGAELTASLVEEGRLRMRVELMT